MDRVSLPFYGWRLSAARPISGYPENLDRVGQHIRKTRLDRRLNQKAAATLFGVDPVSLKNWEEGRTNVEVRFYPRIIKWLGYDPIPAGGVLGDQIRNERMRRGWSRKRLARAAGVDEGTVKRLEAGKIVLINLDKGRLGEGPSALLGSLLLSHIALAGLARSAKPEAERRDFAVLLDEFQIFTTQSLVDMLSELRKFRVSMILATQYLGSLERPIRDAVFGNVGTIVSFRVGANDAALLAREVGPPLAPEDFTNLPQRGIYVGLLVDGQQARPFSAETISSTSDLPAHVA